MPQFDTSVFPAEIFWTIISFVVLFALLKRWVLPRIALILQQRADVIEDDLAAADDKRQQADQLEKEYAEKLADIDQVAKKAFDEAEKKIVERRHQLMTEWKDEMERRKRDWIEDTEVMHQQTLREIRAQAAELITVATERLIHQKIGKNEARIVLEESIDALQKIAKSKEAPTNHL